MKKYVLLLTILALTVSFFLSQRPAETKSESRFDEVGRPLFARASAFAVSKPLRDIALTTVAPGAPLQDLSVREVGAGNELFSLPVVQHQADQSLADFGSTPMPAPAISVPGLANLDNALIYSLLILPPDMNGDVGPNHYVQIVNSLFRVFDKTGQPMAPPMKINKLFEPLGTLCSTRNDGLAVVLYDPLADRWLISQTCSAFPPFREMLAISKTGDPLGEYSSYEFVMPNVKLNDFPKFGVWPDGYYMSTDEFLGADYVGAGAFAFDRSKLLAGDPTAGYVYFNLPVPVSPRQKGLLPSDLDGLRPPPAGAPNVFASYTATEYGDVQDALRLYDFHADFNDPLSSTFSERGESPLAVAAFDPTSPEGRADISQRPPGEKLDSQSDRLNFRLSYRNFGTYESLVVNQTVRTAPSEPYRAGVRVYELRKTGPNYAVREQSTIGNAASSRWIGSAALDHQGNLAVQYNLVSDDKEPAIFYTGKLAGDTPGAFRTERALVNGTGVQKAFGWRWGEYSAMSVDPVDDCTFWMTNAYYTLESQEFSDFGWLTRIGSFKFAECTAAPRGSITGSVTNAATGQPLPDAIIKAGAYTRTTNTAGSYGTLVLPATYNVTASARGFLPQTISVTVADGQVQSRNFALQPIPIIESAGTDVAGQSCPINQAPEPGEIITLVISLRNTGVLSGSDITATLLPSTEIINPGPPRSYGTLPPGGSGVGRGFTFTISPSVGCGTVVQLNLEIRNGGSFIGNVLIPLQTGARRFALQEKFDGVAAPDLPSGWTTSASENHQLWRTSSSRNQSVPNSLFSPAPLQRGVNEVVSPAFSVTTANAEISFRNWYELETTFLRNRLYDGSVLELKMGGGDWQDILAAGGTFLAGGYDGAIDGCCMNPLAGHLGWSGRSGQNQTSEFITTRAKLPTAAAGQSVQLRFRIGTDIGGFREGQYIDDLAVTDGFTCSCEISGQKAPFDFDGDRKTDLSVYDLNSGGQPDFRITNSSTNQLSSVAWGTTGDVPANADFDGDGKTDIAVYRPGEGIWYIVRSSDGGSITSRFGVASDLVVPADYDGDGKADVAVFRRTSGLWYVLRSSDGQVGLTQFGLAEDKPLSADFDGDGKIDVAVYRPSTGTWYILRSSNGFVDIVRFGVPEDIPVSGDYDGDGRSDVAVFRPSTGIWYVLRSRSGFTAVQFGLSGDLPMQADFDGDGRSDIAVFRPSDKVWYHLRSSDGGFVARLFGGGGERPVPGIFVNR